MSSWCSFLQSLDSPVQVELHQIKRKYSSSFCVLNGESEQLGLPIVFSIHFLPGDQSLPSTVRQAGFSIRITLDENYPASAPLVFLMSHSDLVLAEHFHLKQLRAQLDALIQFHHGNCALRKIFTWLDNNLVHFYQQIDQEKAICAKVKKYKRPKEKKSKKMTVNKDAEPNERQKGKKKKKKCKYFAVGNCAFGEKCRFLHDATQIPLEESGEVVKVVIGKSSESHHEDGVGESNEVIGIEGTRKQTIEWTVKQQLALDCALRKFPSSMEKQSRWNSISNEVEGKSVLDCVARFKYLCKVVDSKKNSKLCSAAVINEDDDQVENAEINVHHQYNRNSAIAPADQRVEIELQPVPKGFEIKLPGFFMHNISTLQIYKLRTQMQCDNCPMVFDVTLSVLSNEWKTQRWCNRCSILHSIDFKPVYLHENNNTATYLNAQNCSTLDIIPCDFLACCFECGAESLFENCMAGKRGENICFNCHVKLVFEVKQYVGLKDGKQMHSEDHSKNSCKSINGKIPKGDILSIGQPLPLFGTCSHYSKSYRWFRFPCCQMAFPCDVCHDLSSCINANTNQLANRMICGKCSKEQSINNKRCNSCSGEVTNWNEKSNHHWHGGSGCRNLNKLDVRDKQKFTGLKKVKSKKESRVGLKAKEIRDKKVEKRREKKG